MDGTLFDSMDPVTSAFIETILETDGRRYAPEEIVEAFTQGPARAAGALAVAPAGGASGATAIRPISSPGTPAALVRR